MFFLHNTSGKFYRTFAIMTQKPSTDIYDFINK